MKHCVYVIEDDKNIAELLGIALKGHSYKVYLFDNVEDALENITINKPNLIICDIMLPQMNGIDAVIKIRKNDIFKITPIIMLTAKDSEIDKIKGLDAGADDYVVKPFSVMELMARVRAHLRKVESLGETTQEIIELGKISLNTILREVFVEDIKIELTFKQFELLKYLLENKNKPISRKEILDKIWGYNYLGESRTVDIHIKTIRKKLLSAENYIKTVRGIGYKISEN